MKKLIIQKFLRTVMALTLTFCWNFVAAQHWEVNPSDYQYDMSLYAKIMQDGEQLDYNVVEVAAFVGDECRGVGTKLDISDDNYVMLMRIRSNVESGETVAFKYFVPEDDETIAIEGYELSFEAGKVVGQPSSPWIVDLPSKLPVFATEVIINKSATAIVIGECETLTATITPENTTDKTLAWTTSDEAVATVDQNGLVTAVSVGSATITATCGSVSGTCTVTVKPILASAVTLDKTEVTLVIGEQETITATITPDNTTDKTLEWHSSDPNVATVDNNGTISAISVGSSTITVSCGDAKVKCQVTVLPIEAQSITLDTTTANIYVGETYQLSATVLPENTTDKTVTWTSSDDAIAAVDAQGKVNAIAQGTATITATCGSASAACQVTVNKKDQTITWAQDIANLKVGDEIYLQATASSGLQVAFQIIKGSEFAEIKEGKLKITAPGTIEVQASQEGNEAYNAAQPIVKTILATAGIPDIQKGNIAVTSQNGEIIVTGLNKDAIIAVYDLAGNLIYIGTDHRISVMSAKQYIVVAGNSSFKIQTK